MSGADPSVYASLPATIIAYAEALGVERRALLTAAGLSEADLEDPDELVSYEALIGVWNLLLALFAHLEAQLASPPLAPRPRLVDRVRQQIEAALGEATPGQTEVAKALGMSARTMQRKLTEDGTSFSELLDGIRRTRALALLEEPALSVQEVAYLLGYSEPQAFHRSFKRWTGKSAGQWRRRSMPRESR